MLNMTLSPYITVIKIARFLHGEPMKAPKNQATTHAELEESYH